MLKLIPIKSKGKTGTYQKAGQFWKYEWDLTAGKRVKIKIT